MRVCNLRDDGSEHGEEADKSGRADSKTGREKRRKETQNSDRRE